MDEKRQILLLDYSQHIYERVVRYRTTEYESRRELINFLLKSISTTSILLASGWIILVTSSNGIPISDDILIACGVHIAVVGLCILTTFALILAHTSAKCCFEEIEKHWGEIYSSSLVAQEVGVGDGGKTMDTLMGLHRKFAEASPRIRTKWDPKTVWANRAAWLFGSLAVVLFIGSLALDVQTGVLVTRRAIEHGSSLKEQPEPNAAQLWPVLPSRPSPLAFPSEPKTDQ